MTSLTHPDPSSGDDPDDSRPTQERLICRCRFFAKQNTNARGRQALRIQILCLVLLPLRLVGLAMGWVPCAFHVADLSLLLLGFVAAWLQRRDLLLLFVVAQTLFLAAGVLQTAQWVLLLTQHRLPVAFSHPVPRPWAVAIVCVDCASLAGTFVAITLALRFRHIVGESDILRHYRLQRKMRSHTRGPSLRTFAADGAAQVPAPPAQQEQLVAAVKGNSESWRSFIFDEVAAADRPPPDCFIETDTIHSPPWLQIHPDTLEYGQDESDSTLDW